MPKSNKDQEKILKPQNKKQNHQTNQSETKQSQSKAKTKSEPKQIETKAKSQPKSQPKKIASTAQKQKTQHQTPQSDRQSQFFQTPKPIYYHFFSNFHDAHRFQLTLKDDRESLIYIASTPLKNLFHLLKHELLTQKHPERLPDVFLFEGHQQNKPNRIYVKSYQPSRMNHFIDDLIRQTLLSTPSSMEDHHLSKNKKIKMRP